MSSRMNSRMRALVLGAWLAGCSSTVGGSANDAATDVASATDVSATDVSTTDASLTCTLPNGRTCAAGTTCPAGDPCGNTCACPAGGGAATCTLRDCPMMIDAGPPACDTTAQCPSNTVCEYPVGVCAARGACQGRRLCDDPNDYCGCTAGSYRACQPDRPTRSLGPCTLADASVDVSTVDASTGGCRSASDCADGRVCYFTVGACGATGRCEAVRDCASITPFCGCDGATFMDCPGDLTTTPARRAGACASADAGSPDAAVCGGASIGPTGRECLGPADGTLPVWCCTGWDCDQSHAACDSLPPVCAEGESPTVAMGCWGPCVPTTNCAPRRM